VSTPIFTKTLVYHCILLPLLPHLLLHLLPPWPLLALPLLLLLPHCTAATKIAISAAVAAAFWLIGVFPLLMALFPSADAIACPRLCNHYLPAPLSMTPSTQPPPMFLPPSLPPLLPIFLLPSPLPLCFNFSNCLYVSTFLLPRLPLPLFLSPTSSVSDANATVVSAKAQSLTKSASLQVIRHQWRTVAVDTTVKSDGKQGVCF
jgi:hypothetical protein